MTRQEIHACFDRRVEAWIARDIAALVEGYTEDGVLESPIAAATGKRFTFPAALIRTMRDGRMAHQRRVYDFTGFLMEIGVLMAKPV